MNWTPHQIIEATGGRRLYGPPGVSFNGVGIDSRTIGGDQLFVAICGANHDGHAFADRVIQMGVKGLVVAQHPAVALTHESWQSRGVTCIAVADTTRALGALANYQRNRFDIPVVAITGSNGKTTTRQMSTLVMSRQFHTLATQGNFNNEIGLPLTLFNLAAEHEAAVLELGMNHPGEIARLGAICRPTIGVITNVGPAHLEFLGSLEGVARAKAELMAQVDPRGVMVLNLDDPHVAALADETDRRVLFFGLGSGAGVRAEHIRESERGISFDLVLPSGRVPVRLNTSGRFMVANALAAAAAGHAAGVGPDGIKAGLEAFAPTKGRLQVITTAGGISIIDDTYNANPASMAAAFETLKGLRKKQPGIIIMGDMLELGDQSPELHRRAGRQAALSGAARLYAHGPHADNVRQGALAAGMDEACTMIGDKVALAQDVIRHLEPGAWVLVKGSRGMAMETVVQAIRQWADGVSSQG